VLGRGQCSCVAIVDHGSDTRSLAESMRARLSTGMQSPEILAPLKNAPRALRFHFCARRNEISTRKIS